MVLALIVLLAGAGAAGAGVAALLRRRGVPDRAALWCGLAAGLAGGLTVVLYGFEQLAYALDDTGPDVYGFSPFAEYHDIGGLTEAALIAGYVAIPVALVAAGALSRVYDGRPLGMFLCVAGGVAVFLPWFVPARLDKYEVGSTPVLHTFRSGEVRGADVRVCMNYGVPRDGKPQTAGLCLDLARTPRSEQLLDLADGDELGVDDVTDTLNDRRVMPREDPGDLGELGLEVRRHRWYDGRAPLP